MDNHTPEQRKYNMAQIRSVDTKPEEQVRKYLFSKGFRYRKNVKDLPGKPDIVLPKYRCIIFVHGCFWHMHNCGRFHWPKSNESYWRKKILGNVERDVAVKEELENMGWRVIVVWECQLKKSVFQVNMKLLVDSIKEGV